MQTSSKGRELSVGFEAIDFARPSAGSIYWCIAEERRTCLAHPKSQAGPGPVPRPLHQPGSEGIPLHVSYHRQQVLVTLNGEGLEATLPDMPGGAVLTMMPADVGG